MIDFGMFPPENTKPNDTGTGMLADRSTVNIKQHSILSQHQTGSIITIGLSRNWDSPIADKVLRTFKYQAPRLPSIRKIGNWLS